MNKLRQQELAGICGGSIPSSILLSPGFRLFSWLFSGDEDSTCTYTDDEGNNCPCEE